MLLRSLWQAASDEGLLANPDYEPKPVEWIITVDGLGEVVDCARNSGGGFESKVLSIPRRIGRSNAAKADFLVDKSEYVLGLDPLGKRSFSDLGVRSSLFREAVDLALKATGELALFGVKRFLENDGQRRVVVDAISDQGYRPNDLFAFQYEGQLVHDLPKVQEFFSKVRHDVVGPLAQCLVCGLWAPAVDKHPHISLPGGSLSGVALVSFNSDAFESYGLFRNMNAPVCRGCADGYTTALRRLLSDKYPNPDGSGRSLPRRFVRLSPNTTALFWSDSTSPLLDWIPEFFDAPSAESIDSLVSLLNLGEMSDANNFHCSILSGGQGRATVRRSSVSTDYQIGRNLAAFFLSTNIYREKPMPLARALRALAFQETFEAIPSVLVSDIFIALLFGGRFPQAILPTIVQWCKAQGSVSPARAALLHEYFVRNAGWKPTPSVGCYDSYPGYQLGRLAAVVARILVTVGRHSAEAQYSSASTRPASVFPQMVLAAKLSLSALPVGLRDYYGSYLRRILDDIAGFPSQLSIEQQAAFALGQSQQTQDFYAVKDGLEPLHEL